VGPVLPSMPNFYSKIAPATVPLVDIHNFVFGSDTFESKHSLCALVDAATGEQVTYAELLLNINKLAAGLHRKLRVGKGTVVGIHAPNHLDWPALSHAVVKLGKPRWQSLAESEASITHAL
jgi:fatty-acyl-CoA synthase